MVLSNSYSCKPKKPFNKHKGLNPLIRKNMKINNSMLPLKQMKKTQV